MTPLEKYLLVEEELLRVRELGGTEEDEDRILDFLDEIWYKMSQEDRDFVNSRETIKYFS